MKNEFKVAFILLVAFFACSKADYLSDLDKELERNIGDVNQYILPASTDYEHIPHSDVNPLTEAKVKLGMLLFFEPAFAVEAKQSKALNTFSCSSCHIPSQGFRPGRVQGIADGAFGFGQHGEGRAKYPEYLDEDIDAQGARPLATINVAFVKNTMWNGSFGDQGVNVGTEKMWGVFDPGTAINAERLGNLEGQNIEGLKTHRLLITKALVEQYGYKSLFDKAFPDVAEADRYTRRTASFAISAYLRTLVTDRAPFQLWLKGYKQAMTDQQKRGAVLFFGKLGCDGCHFDKNLGSTTFHALGLKDLFENGGLKTSLADRRNLGRGGFTGEAADMFKFRAPQLYNLGDGGPYFHGATKNSLEEVVDYFNNGIPENPRVPKEQLSYFLKPLGMTANEKADLVAFLRYGLKDPNLDRYVPSQVLSKMCFPNNDPKSKQDMGCN